jgi:DNA-binding CsgD family transcriptional regulator
VLAGARYDDQYHLPQATLDIGVTLATAGPDAAVALAGETLDRHDLSLSGPRYVWPLLTMAAIAAREAPGDAATVLLDRLRTLSEKMDVFGPVQRAWQLSFAALDPRAGSGAGEAGPGGGADPLAAADAAAAAWEAIEQPYPAAVALRYAAAAALDGPAGREAAAARLRRAAPVANRLGARPLAGQLAALARRADSTADGAPGDGGGTGPAAGRLGLTSREFEVLRLVAAGQSNREIAAALFISPKTASVHVSNILAKLGTATRTEAAARAHVLRLFESPS